MPKPNEFVSHLLNLLAPLGGVTVRSMFGGWGFYRDTKFFAIVAADTFYVKVDDVSRSDFEAANLHPFVYGARHGTTNTMSYYTVPTSALDSREELCVWAWKGLDAAERAKTVVKKKAAKARK